MLCLFCCTILTIGYKSFIIIITSMKGGLRQSVLLQEGKKKLEMEKLCLIDVSQEDDSLIPSTAEEQCSSDGFQISELVEDPLTLSEVSEDDANRQEDKDSNSKCAGINRELSPMSKDLFQPKRTRTVGQCNLRRSLAWDKAFFTNQGVLNPEELSLVNKTFKKPEEQLLPSIEEEMRTSMESIASFVGEDLILRDLEEKLFEQKQSLKQKSEDQADEIHDAASICNKAGASKQKPENDGAGTHDAASICNKAGASKQKPENDGAGTRDVASGDNRKVGSKQNSGNEDDKTNGVASMSSRIGGNKCEMGEVGPKLSTALQHPSQPKTKPLITAKKQSMKKVVESTPQKGSRLQLPTSLSVKKSSIRSKEELQKPLVKQPKGTSGNNDSSAPTSLTKKISSVSKRVKDTLGKVLPANMGRTYGHSISSGNAKDDSIISARSTPSPNSAVSESACSSKLSRCYSYTSFQRFAKPVCETTMETNVGINYGTLDTSDSDELSAYSMDNPNSKHCSSTSPGSSLDGLSSVSSPTFSNNPMVSFSQSNMDDVVSCNQFTSAVDVSLSTESQVSECSRQSHGLENIVPGTLILANMNVPVTDDSNRVSSIARHCPSLDDSSNNGSSQSRAYRSKPSGLRMPSPKIGFFDAASVPMARNPLALHEKSAGYVRDKKLLPYSGVHSRPPRLSPWGSGGAHQECKPKPCGIHSIRPPGVPSASHSRPDVLLKSFIPSGPAQSCRPQLKSNPGTSTQSLLGQQKPEFSFKVQQVPSGLSSDGKQYSLDGCQKAPVIVEGACRKLCSQMDSFDADHHNQQGSCVSVAGASQYQLSVLDGSATLQDGSEALGCEAIYTHCTEAMAASEPAKAFEPSTVIDIKPGNCDGSSFLADGTVRSSEFDSVKSKPLSLPQREMENATERDVSEDFPVFATTKTEIECSSFQNEQEVSACCQVSQAFDQIGYLDELVETRISDLPGTLQLNHEDERSLVEYNLSDSALDCLNTALLNNTDPFRSPSQHSDWPVYEDVASVSREKSNEKIDSSPASTGFYQQSVSSGAHMEYKPMYAFHEMKTCGRIPLAVNCDFSSAAERQEIQKQQIREKGSMFAFTKKAASRLPSLPTSPVLADISGQENSISDEKYPDSPLHKNRRRRSIHDPSDEKGNIKNFVDTPLFSEENIYAFETTGVISSEMRTGIKVASEQIAPQLGMRS